MGNTGTTLATIVLFASMNTGNVIRTIDSDMLPTCNATYHYTQDISNWRENAFNTYSNQIPNNRDSLKLDIIIAFSKKILENSSDIENEFVEVVNNKFWDLI